MLRRHFALSCALVAATLGGPVTAGAPVARGRDDVGYGVVADTDARATALPARALPLPFHYDLYTFRGQGDSTAVVAAFSISAGLLQREVGGRGVRYRFDVSLVLADTALRSVARTDDSVYVHFARPLLAEHLLYTQLELEELPSRSTVQRVIMTDATIRA
jgi:hypothetical protein